jgi:hypothetical protein
LPSNRTSSSWKAKVRCTGLDSLEDEYEDEDEDEEVVSEEEAEEEDS